MYYAIRHLTRYQYSAPVRENVTEVRMQPRTEGNQRCLEFELSVDPPAQITSYEDALGNRVHHFDIPGSHHRLRLTARALVEVQQPPPLPEALPSEAWQALDDLVEPGAFWDMLQPSRFTRPTPLLQELAAELGLTREADPLTVLRKLNRDLYRAFAYAPMTTQVDSSIDEAIANRRGVCQDFTHIMLALVRSLGIPCRYVSGYLFHRFEDHDRSAEDATHAWLEAFLPDLGWVGFDPTNDLTATERHIRVAVGRDYADIPPTRGVFKGAAEEELHVGVQVTLADAPPDPEEELLPESLWSLLPEEEADVEGMQQ